MQPLQYDLRSSATKDNSITHAAAAPSNLDAAITMRFAASPHKTCTHLRTWQRQMTTIMQPFQCGLQPQIPKHPITTHAQAHPKQLEATVTMRQKKMANRPQPHPPHTRYLSSPPVATAHGKIQGFVLRLPPQTHFKAHATFMQPLQYVSQHHVANLHVSTHMATPDDNNHEPFQCDLQPQIPKHPIMAHTQAQPKQLEATVTMRQEKKGKPTAAAPTAHRRSRAACSHFTRKNTRFRAPTSSPKQISKPRQHSCSHYNMFRSITSQTCTSLHTWQHQMTTIMRPFQCNLQPQIQETNRTTHTGTTTRCKTHRRNHFATETTPAAPAAHTRYLSSPAATTLHGKIQGFVLRLPSQNKAQATSMQPLHYVSQHPVLNLHLSTRMATPDDNNQAAIPMRSATTDSRNAGNYAHRHNHWLQNTEEDQMRPERPQPHPPHTRGIPFIAGCNHFTRKNTRFRAPASSPTHSPCNIHAAIPMRSATTASRTA